MTGPFNPGDIRPGTRAAGTRDCRPLNKGLPVIYLSWLLDQPAVSEGAVWA